MARSTQLWFLWLFVSMLAGAVSGSQAPAAGLQEQVDFERGVGVFIGLPSDGGANAIVELAKETELLIHVQSSRKDEVEAMQQAALEAKLLGRQIWVSGGKNETIQLATNCADAVVVAKSATGADGVSRKELLRVLHPGAKGFLGDEVVAKLVPAGVDDWSHPYHGPDNNTQSTDDIARYPYLTQFLGEPMFGCISENTVASGGRVFKAFGHIAFKKISNEVLNKLYAINGYNGTILWTRPLNEGFMVHRNTMVATPDALYMADNQSCKVIDPETGDVMREIKPDEKLAGGTVWKWMALKGGVLYAMIGGEEVETKLRRGDAEGYGGWPWGMWPGYDYKDPSKAWALGRHLLAINAETGEILWDHQQQHYLDGRAVTMSGERIYAYSPDRYLTCIDAKSGQMLWKSDDKETLEAIGANGRAQGYIRGFASTCYMKSDGDFLYFAGPQRERLTVVSAKDGKLAWTFGDGNFQLILRDEHLYAFGKQGGKSFKLQPATGEILAEFAGRRACTRATGSVDSLFCRARGGTIRFNPADNKIEHIAPMRPACHDGVIISDGHLYWGPWICACKLSLFGHIGLGPAGDFNFDTKPTNEDRLKTFAGDLKEIALSERDPRDRFTAGEDGVVRKLQGDKIVWQVPTGGSINFDPVEWNGRVYAGSNDGHVYAFEAATGKLLWTFRAAPEVRRINVYGQLMSTWPVAGGVAVHDGVVYAAAGIAHYDGTHVYALNAVNGQLVWHNGNSGTLNDELKNGISLCGPLRVGPSQRGKEVLQFPGGNAVATAMYDLESGACLSDSPNTPTGVARSTFYVEQWIKRRTND